MNRAWGAGLMVFGVASGACIDLAGHSCSGVGYFCDQTSITLQSPKNAWSPGMYTLNLNVEGKATKCMLSISDPPPTGTVQGTCSATDITWTLTQLCPQPAPVCNATACEGMASSANCLPGQFQMTVVVSPKGFGADAGSGIASKVALDLHVDGKSLVNKTITPSVATTEPNGAGCGTCTNASATLSVAGG